MTAATIDRRTMPTGWMYVFSVLAAGPLVVFLGAISSGYAVSGTPGLPLAFLLVTGVLALLSVGYAGVARRVPHAAPYYAVIARGLGHHAGVAAGFLALTAYNAILCCMYGLLGGYLAQAMIGGTWWVYSLIAWGFIALLGVRPVAVSSRVLIGSLVIAVLIIGSLIIAAVNHPAGGHFSWEGFTWRALGVGSVASAFVVCVASVMGFDGVLTFSTEAVHTNGPRRAMIGGLLTLGVVYALMAGAVGVANGPDQVAAVSADPNAHVPLNTMVTAYGFLMAPVSQAAGVFGMFSAMLSVHAIVARYGYAMATEQVLPAWVAHTGQRGRPDTPVGGSLLQSAAGLILIAGFAASGQDPMHTMFPWLATIGALGLVALLCAASLAAMFYLRSEDGVWTRWVAPLTGLPCGIALFVAMLAHGDALLDTEPGSALPWVMVAVLVLVVAGGLAWAAWLCAKRPDAYARISYGVPHPLKTPERVLTAMEL
jgi:amino acid transporter